MKKLEEKKLEDKIVKSIHRCRFNLKPRNGDCGNVAAALDKFFTDCTLTLISSEKTEIVPAHFCVVIDGNIYDGCGNVTINHLIEQFCQQDIDTSEEYDYIWEYDSVHEITSVESNGYVVMPEVREEIITELEREFEWGFSQNSSLLFKKRRPLNSN